MSIEYAEKKVTEAMDLSAGNKTKANALLFQWIQEDHALLLGMSALHMKGIIPFWTDRIERQQSIAKATDRQAKAVALKAQGKKQSFGKEMLKSFAGQKTAEFGMDNGAAPLRRKEASQRHVDAMKLLSEINKRKRKDS